MSVHTNAIERAIVMVITRVILTMIMLSEGYSMLGFVAPCSRKPRSLIMTTPRV